MSLRRLRADPCLWSQVASLPLSQLLLMLTARSLSFSRARPRATRDTDQNTQKFKNSHFLNHKFKSFIARTAENLILVQDLLASDIHSRLFSSVT